MKDTITYRRLIRLLYYYFIPMEKKDKEIKNLKEWIKALLMVLALALPAICYIIGQLFFGAE